MLLLPTLLNDELAADRLGQFWPEERAGGVRSGPTFALEQSSGDFHRDCDGEGHGVAHAEPAFPNRHGWPLHTRVRPRSRSGPVLRPRWNARYPVDCETANAWKANERRYDGQHQPHHSAGRRYAGRGHDKGGMAARHAASNSPLAPLAVPITSPSGVVNCIGSPADWERTRRPCRTCRPPKDRISTMVAAKAEPMTPGSVARDARTSTRTRVGRG